MHATGVLNVALSMGLPMLLVACVITVLARRNAAAIAHVVE